MGYNIKFTKEAYADLNEIVAYISESLANPSAATAVVNELEEKLRYVQETPNMYELCLNPYLLEKSYRKFSVKNYIVFLQSKRNSQNSIYYANNIWKKRLFEVVISSLIPKNSRSVYVSGCFWEL